MPELTAYHEAGHAWMAVVSGARVESVTITPDWDEGPERHGDTQVAWQLGRFTECELAKKGAVVSLAGPVAEMAYNNELSKQLELYCLSRKPCLEMTNV